MRCHRCHELIDDSKAFYAGAKGQSHIICPKDDPNMAPKYRVREDCHRGVWQVLDEGGTAFAEFLVDGAKFAREYAAWMNSRRKDDAYARYVALLAAGKCDAPETEALRLELGIRPSIDQVSP